MKEEMEQEEYETTNGTAGQDICEHVMIYSQTIGIVGGYCSKCGYKTY